MWDGDNDNVVILIQEVQVVTEEVLSRLQLGTYNCLAASAAMCPAKVATNAFNPVISSNSI